MPRISGSITETSNRSRTRRTIKRSKALAGGWMMELSLIPAFWKTGEKVSQFPYARRARRWGACGRWPEGFKARDREALLIPEAVHDGEFRSHAAHAIVEFHHHGIEFGLARLRPVKAQIGLGIGHGLLQRELRIEAIPRAADIRAHFDGRKRRRP